MTDAPGRVWFTLVPQTVYLTLSTDYASRAEVMEDMRRFGDEFLQMIEDSPAPLVHLIVYSKPSFMTPTLRESLSLPFLKHPRLGYTLTIGAVHNSVLRFLLDLLSGMLRARYQDVETVQAACALLASKDATLPPLDAWHIPNEAEIAAADAKV